MASRRSSPALALAVATVFAVVVTAHAQVSQEAPPQSAYEAAVLALQIEADAAPAHRLEASWTHHQFESAVARLRRESPHLDRAASLLHIELALSAVESAPDEALWHIRLGEQLLQSLARTPPSPRHDFVARWTTVASSVFQARTDLPRARLALAFGLTRRPHDSSVRLHAGIVEDLTSLIEENDDTGLADRQGTQARRMSNLHMARAEREYRESLRIAPDNAPARIRLGRLLHRRGRFEEARAELEQTRAAVLPAGERHLLLLFLSATYEALNDAARAGAALQECVQVAGNQQSAWLALAQFDERSGRPQQARDAIAQGIVQGQWSHTDAWWDYRHGGFDSEGFAWLRGIARSSP